MHFDDPDLLEKKMAAEIYLELLVKSGRSSGTDVDWFVEKGEKWSKVGNCRA